MFFPSSVIMGLLALTVTSLSLVVDWGSFMENVGSMSFLIRPQSVVWLPYGQDTACCFAVFIRAGSPGCRGSHWTCCWDVLQQQLTTSVFLGLRRKQNLWTLFSSYFPQWTIWIILGMMRYNRNWEQPAMPRQTTSWFCRSLFQLISPVS